MGPGTAPVRILDVGHNCRKMKDMYIPRLIFALNTFPIELYMRCSSFEPAEICNVFLENLHGEMRQQDFSEIS